MQHHATFWQQFSLKHNTFNTFIWQLVKHVKYKDKSPKNFTDMFIDKFHRVKASETVKTCPCLDELDCLTTSFLNFLLIKYGFDRLPSFLSKSSNKHRNKVSTATE